MSVNFSEIAIHGIFYYAGKAWRKHTFLSARAFGGSAIDCTFGHDVRVEAIL